MDYVPSVHLPSQTRRLAAAVDEALGANIINPEGDFPEGIGYRIRKVQKKVFGEIKGLRVKGLERRADNLPPCRPAAHGLGVFGQRSFCKLVAAARGDPDASPTPDKAHAQHINSCAPPPPVACPSCSPPLLHQRFLHCRTLFGRSKPFVGAAGPLAVAVDT